jgi:hypothetical protein
VTTTTNAAVTNVINATDTAANSGVQQPPQKSIGMGVNDIDAEDQIHDGTGINQQMKMDNLVGGQCLNLPFEAKADGTVKHKQRKAFFDRVDELKAFKEKHGRINVRKKDDASLYDFCNNLRQARKGRGTYRLDETRIAALDAIGFDWEVGASSSVYKSFFAWIDELKVYKEKHGHLNIRQKEEKSLYYFCSKMRQARKGKIHTRLNDDRIAALDAISFNWDPL